MKVKKFSTKLSESESESEKFYTKSTKSTFTFSDLKVGKVKIFQQNYHKSEKFFTKFLYFFERENFQNLIQIRKSIPQ